MRKHYYGNDNHVGLGTFDVLTLIFIVLKLTGVIDWSWRWVLSPWWISILIVLVMFFIIWLQD